MIDSSIRFGGSLVCRASFVSYNKSCNATFGAVR